MSDRLYNIHRPTSFNDVLSQDNLTSLLKGLINHKSYQYRREYLFHSSIGGVGKTTLAKIFAKTIMCQERSDSEPCNKCENCKQFDSKNRASFDFIEVNGATYSGVDQIETLINIANQYPIDKNGYRIILIDEFQRVSSAAQSKLLELFEFGKNRTILIMTTTQLSSINSMILTRTFNFEVKPIKTQDISQSLITICKNDKIEYTEEDIQKIAFSCEGSLREAIKLLDLYSQAYGKLVDITLSSSLDSLVQAFRFLILGNVVDLENIIMDYPSATIYDDMCRVLTDIKLSPHISKYIQQLDCDYIKSVLHSKLDDIIKDFIKLKPMDAKSMFMFMTLYLVEGGMAVKESKGINNRRTAGASTKELMKKYGFEKYKKV